MTVFIIDMILAPSIDSLVPKNKNNNPNEIANIKLSRTQRAINAKDERYKNMTTEENSEKKKGFTRDGIEALKPFQSAVNEEESHSS